MKLIDQHFSNDIGKTFPEASVALLENVQNMRLDVQQHETEKKTLYFVKYSNWFFITWKILGGNTKDCCLTYPVTDGLGLCLTL